MKVSFPIDHWLAIELWSIGGIYRSVIMWLLTGKQQVQISVELNVLLLQTRKYEGEIASGGDPLGARGTGVGAESPLPLTASSPDTNNAELQSCKISPPGLSSSSLPETGTNNILRWWTCFKFPAISGEMSEVSVHDFNYSLLGSDTMSLDR